MKIFHKSLGNHIAIGIDLNDDDSDELESLGEQPIKGEKPRGSYIYFHRDCDGNIFYVGKGTGRRAWSKERHYVWNKYVQERLGGKYEVEIYRDGLDEAQAEELEAHLIQKYGDQLVNWSNPGRDFDYAALDRFHELRNINRKYVADTRPLEKTDPEQAVARYREALTAMREYESITYEKGLIAELGGGPDWGDYNILDRLTLTLIKLGRHKEAVEEADNYFADFPSALKLASVKKIISRIEKARKKVIPE